ncbi:hypothetical protein [Pseudonocardia kunmingensis]|uniref:hypothetical protein n=1 Tax=Pseudonocardia kunmingensis TaxID=630975 RepID=UPI00114D95FA|nr:hypothetical protein [Pseudonocardia kunmingensis]
MTTTSPLGRARPAPALRPGGGSPRPVAIRVVWPDREHAVIEMVGTVMSPGSVAELRERVDALLIGGLRFLLVDLSEAQPCDGAVRAVLADAATRLRARLGWLRIHPDPDMPPPPDQGVDDATLPDLFRIYRAMAGDTGGRRGH